MMENSPGQPVLAGRSARATAAIVFAYPNFLAEVFLGGRLHRIPDAGTSFSAVGAIAAGIVPVH